MSWLPYRMATSLYSVQYACYKNELMELMRVTDGQAVERRRKRILLRRRCISPEPNYAWHIYGYDKRKPFGFAIHGAIDVFLGDSCV